jgi:acetylglutamate kinase
MTDISMTQALIAKLLTNIGSRSEVEQYLRYYASTEPQKFAIVKASGQVLEQSRDDLVSSLAFLHRVGLRPITVIGARPQLRRALAEAGIETQVVNGMRVTPPEVLAIARRVFEAESLHLAEALEALGTRARPITAGVFQTEPHPDARLGLVGRVASVVTTSIMSAIRTDQLPILAPFGETADGQILRLDSDTVTPALALALKPHKIILLAATGGLLDRTGRVIPAINLEEDLDGALEVLENDDKRRRLQMIAEVLRELPRTTSISITSPEHVARELFTHRGAGTLIRLGECIRVYDTFDAVDRVRMRDLLEQSFGRRLSDEYFMSKIPYRIYLAESYRATAILTREHVDSLDIPYLDKFGVTAEAQGEGIGSSIWQRMSRENPRLFWRSRTTNPINGWYAQRADGMYKAGYWTVFWIGIHEFSEIRACVEKALSLPASLGTEEP